LNVKKAVQL